MRSMLTVIYQNANTIMKLNVGGTEQSVTSQAQGNLNTVLGSIGTLGALSGGNRCGGGILGNIFGNNCGGNDSCVDQQELWYATELAACKGREYALATARQEDALVFNESRRADDKIADVLKQTNDGLIAVGNGVSRLDVKTACLEEKLNWIREESARNLREAKEYTDQKVQCEAQLRKAGDDALAAWTQSELNKKIDGVMKIDGSMVSYGQCRPVLEACPCGSANNPFNVNVIIEQAVAAALKAVNGK